MQIKGEPLVDVRGFSELCNLYDHIDGATERLLELLLLPERSRASYNFV